MEPLVEHQIMEMWQTVCAKWRLWVVGLRGGVLDRWDTFLESFDSSFWGFLFLSGFGRPFPDFGGLLVGLRSFFFGFLPNPTPLFKVQFLFFGVLVGVWAYLFSSSFQKVKGGKILEWRRLCTFLRTFFYFVPSIVSDFGGCIFRAFESFYIAFSFYFWCHICM